MSNIMASIGIEQFKKRKFLANSRQSLAKHYDKLLINNKDILIFNNDYDKIVPHIYVIKIPNLSDREGLRKMFLDNGIQIGIHYKPNHLLTYFKRDKQLNLPVTESVFSKIITLPLHPDIKIDEVEYIINILNLNIKNFLK